jgi:murein L,D-transpeptidase YcbB/YkuD
LTETSYAVLLSRYDDTMITMLSTEVAGGAFGRSLAALSTEGSGEAAASQELRSKASEYREAVNNLQSELSRHRDLQKKLDQVTDRKGQLQAALREAEAADEASPDEIGSLHEELGRTEQQATDLESSLQKSSESIAKAERELATKLEATAEVAARASAVAAGGITPGQQSPQVAAVLENIQQNYVENINTDAWDVACISALDNEESQLTALGRYCRDNKFHRSSAALKQFVFDTLMEYRVKTNSGLLEAKVELAKAGRSAAVGPRADLAPGGSPEIASIQRALNRLNHEGLVVDGLLGIETRAALRRFQRENGLEMTGQPEPATMARLRAQAPGL